MKYTLTAILIQNGVRYEKDLAQHFMHVAIWNIFPPKRETNAARRAWADRIIGDTPVEGYFDET